MSEASVELTAVAATAEKVREYLSPFDDVIVSDDGTCRLSYGSAQVIVSVDVFDEDQAVVHVRSQCVTGATVSPELFRHVATFEPDMGHLHVIEAPDGTATISFAHSLLGEFLNPAELRMTVVAVAYLADRFDDDLAARFGGQVHDATGNV
jgi:hypothetical protein